MGSELCFKEKNSGKDSAVTKAKGTRDFEVGNERRCCCCLSVHGSEARIRIGQFRAPRQTDNNRQTTLKTDLEIQGTFSFSNRAVLP